MNEPIALILSVIAAMTAIATAVFTWWKFYYDKKAWLIELKKGYSLEVYKARLETYPTLLTQLIALSSVTLDVEHVDAGKIVADINGWLYGKGGLVAERQLRNCVVHLRNALGRPEISVNEVVHWKHMSIFYLRYDLDIFGLEDSSSSYQTGLLTDVKKRVERLIDSKAEVIHVVGRYGDPGWKPDLS